MRDMVRRPLLVEPSDMDRFESWMEHMARKGLYYHHQGPLFLYFRRAEPAPARFRLEPVGALGSLESLDYCQAQGWTPMGTLGKQYQLYMSLDPEAPELHTDPVVRSYGLEKLARAMKLQCTVLTLLVLFFLAWVILFPLFLFDFPIHSLLTSYSSTGLSVIMELMVLGSALRSYAAFFSLKRRLQEGLSSRHDGSWQRVAGLNIATVVITTLLLILGLWGSWGVFHYRWEGEIGTVDRPYPILSLQALDGEDMEPVRTPSEVFDGQDRNNFVRYEWYPLLPQSYEVDQRAARGGYEADLDMEWYRLAIPAIASPLLDELVYRYTEHNYFPDEYTVEEIVLPGFDRAVLATDKQWPGQRLFLQKGDVVIYLDYSGEQDLTQRPDLLAGLLG